MSGFSTDTKCKTNHFLSHTQNFDTFFLYFKRPLLTKVIRSHSFLASVKVAVRQIFNLMLLTRPLQPSFFHHFQLLTIEVEKYNKTLEYGFSFGHDYTDWLTYYES